VYPRLIQNPLPIWLGRERGWPPMTRASFDAQRGPNGALLVGNWWATRTRSRIKSCGTPKRLAASRVSLSLLPDEGRFSVPFGQQARLATLWGEQRAASTDAT
jgi:hypothetical protein